MELMYSSTRNDKVKLTASQAILKGLADDGGLFVPERIPALDVPIHLQICPIRRLLMKS